MHDPVLMTVRTDVDFGRPLRARTTDPAPVSSRVIVTVPLAPRVAFHVPVMAAAPVGATATTERAAASAAAVTRTVTASQTTFGQGTFIVGTDMQAGRYRSSAAADGCYWERLSGFGGGLSDIIANDNVDGTAIVDIAATDKGFSSSRCGTWTLVP